MRYIKTENIARNLRDAVVNKTRDGIDNETLYFLNNNSSANQLIDNFCDTQRVENIIGSVRSRDKVGDIQKMKNGLKIKESQRNRYIRPLITSLTAAAILALSFLIYDGVSINKRVISQAGTKIKNNDIVIITPKGQVINLDDNVKNIVANEINGKELHKMNEVDANTINLNQLIVPSRKTIQIELPDGSIANMNASSKLSYPSSFHRDNRIVTLEGEAFFDIKEDEKPFIVQVGESRIKVYGTQFNVKQQKNGDLETVLIEGSIGLTHMSNKEIMLKPNQCAVVDVKSNNCEVIDINATHYIKWMEDSFNYENTKAIIVIEDMERWFGIEINNIDTNLFAREKISLNIDKSYSEAKVISLIEYALGITIINEGGGTYSIE